MIKIILFAVLLALFAILSIKSLKDFHFKNPSVWTFAVSFVFLTVFGLCEYFWCNIKIISWQNICFIAIYIFSFCICYITEKKKKRIIGVMTLFIISVCTLTLACVTLGNGTGLFTKTIDINEKVETVAPTIEPITKKVSIGYSINSNNEAAYFYLEEKDGVMYYTPIKNPKIYYVSGQDSSVIIKIKTTTYLDKDRKDAPRWSKEEKSYTLYVNSKDVIYVETDA